MIFGIQTSAQEPRWPPCNPRIPTDIHIRMSVGRKTVCLYILGIKKQFLAAVSLMYSVTFCLFGYYLLKTPGKLWRKSIGKPGPSVDTELPCSHTSGRATRAAAEEPSPFTAQHQIRSVMLLVRLLLLLSVLSRKPIKVPAFDILTHVLLACCFVV